MRKNVLIFDDDIKVLNTLESLCQSCGCNTYSFSYWKPDSIDYIVDLNPSVIFLDERFHGMKGSDICMILRSVNQLMNTKIYLISARKGLEPTANYCGADGYVEKPFSLQDIKTLLV